MDQLAAFTEYASRLKGDEKGEAQVFIDRLFKAFGHEGYKEAGAVLEERVKGRLGGTRFADLVWQPRVLIEMKARRESLAKHYQQMLDYWTQLIPKPKYCILCNFDEFWVYDFNQQMGEPVDQVSLKDLPARAATLAFLRPIEESPVFGSNRIQVTKEAASKIAAVFRSLVGRGIDRADSQRFVLQCIVAIFAEDLNLLPREFFTRILDEASQHRDPGAHAYDLIGSLFRQMNSPKRATGGRFVDVEYFNGGLFANPEPLLLLPEEVNKLREAALEDWSQVNPAIFGTIFQASMDKGERHAFGAHFTSEEDIMKVVMPTIVRPWLERIDKAKTLGDYAKLFEDLINYKVLDPACGSGNFLYVAFRELKRIETSLILAVRHKFTGKQRHVLRRGFVSVKQLYGFDNQIFPVELAKVTLMLAKELALAESTAAIRADGGELGLDFDPALPLDNLDGNIREADALFEEWPSANAIVGNPPYQSKNKMQREYGRAYLNRLQAAYPDVSGKADYCIYFFRKAHDSLKAGFRAGMVGTNTIRQNESREGGLDYIVGSGGTITEAVSTQKWSGDAVVHVSIVNWIKGAATGQKRLSWQLEDGTWNSTETDLINTSLSHLTDVTSALRLSANADGLFSAQGQTHGHEGFLVDRGQAESLIEANKSLSKVLFPYLTGDDLLSAPDGLPRRYVIDFQDMDLFAARKFIWPYARVRTQVLPARTLAADEEAKGNAIALAENPKARVNRHHAGFLATWWQLAYPRQPLMENLSNLPRYIACGRVTKRPIFAFIDAGIHPNDALQVFPFADDYSFGILQSGFHWSWFLARCSTLKGDPRYTSDTVFDTFPWPQKPTAKQVRAVADAAVSLRAIRIGIQKKHDLGLRDLYRGAELPGSNAIKTAQEKLDHAVSEAYGIKPGKKIVVLQFLLDLNLKCAALESKGRSITGPGLPDWIKNPTSFVTKDCVSMR